MKKTKRTSATTAKATNMAKFDFTHKGFALAHEEKTIYVFETTDAAIRNGNEVVLNKALEIIDKYPTYRCAILHVLFLG